MAIASLLCHAFCLNEYQLLSTEYVDGEIVFHVKLKGGKWKSARFLPLAPP